VEALLSDPNREIICDTLMKFSAKAKSFHIAVRGNFPAARDFAEPDTYDDLPTSGGQPVFIGRISRTINHKRSIITHLPVTKTSSQRPSPRAAVERVLATEPRAIRPTNRRSDTRKPPAAARKSTIRISDASGTTAVREEDGRIREDLESLGGR